MTGQRFVNQPRSRLVSGTAFRPSLVAKHGRRVRYAGNGSLGTIAKADCHFAGDGKHLNPLIWAANQSFALAVIVLAEINAGIFCCRDERSSGGAGWLPSFDDGKARLHRADTLIAFGDRPISQQNRCGIFHANHDPITIHAPDLDADWLVKELCSHGGVQSARKVSSIPAIAAGRDQ